MTPPTSFLPSSDQACHINHLGTGLANAPARPMSLTSPGRTLVRPESSASWMCGPTCQPPRSDPPRGYGLLAPYTPTPLTPPLSAEATTSGRSRTRLVHKPTRPLSLLSLAREPAQQTSSTSKAHKPACQTSPSDSRERSGSLAPAPISHGAQTPTPPTAPLLAGATTSGRSRTRLACKPTRPLSLLSLAHEPAQQTSSTSKAREPARQTSPSDSRERSGLLAPAPISHGAQTPTPPTPPLLAGTTTSGPSRTRLAREPTHPLSSLSLAREPAQQTSSTSKAREPACQTSPSDSRERSGLLAPAPIGRGAQTPMPPTPPL
jgi:hypothetical protein